MTAKLQNVLILLGVLAIGGAGIYLFLNNGDVSLNNSLVNNQAAAETSEFLQRLNELKVIELNGDVFNDNRFTSLVDFSSVVAPTSIGKNDPFLTNN